MKTIFLYRRNFLLSTIILLTVSFPLCALSPFELEQLHSNPDLSYIYCDKVHSKMAEVMAHISTLDQDKNSPVWELNRHIQDGFSIGRENAIIEALTHAEEIMNKVISSDKADQIIAMLNSVIDQVSAGKLTVDVQALLPTQTRDASSDDQIIKVREKLYVFARAKFFEDVEMKDDLTVDGKLRVLGKAKFFGDVEIKDDLTVNDTLTVLGTTELNNAIIDCDLTVGCNINIHNSVDATIGNIVKDGAPFIHNFGSSNTFVGIDAGNFTMTGADNTGMGAFALTSNTVGVLNTATGLAALASNSSGSVNTADGAISLVSNTTGSANTAVGFLSMVSNGTGNNNTAVGIAALLSNSTGNDNTAIGAGALDSSTGSDNVALGANAGGTLVSGDDNIYISNAGSAVESGIIRIGTLGTQTAAFMQGIFGAVVAIGGLPVEVDAVGKLGTIVSSAAFKKDIKNMNIPSKKLNQLRPVTFIYKSDTSNSPQYGLIAEEVAQVFPELVVYDLDNQPYSVRYQVLPVLLLHALQNQNATIQALADRVDRLEQVVAA